MPVPTLLIKLIFSEDTSAKKGSGVEDIKKKDATTTDKKDTTENKEKVDKPTPKKNMNEPLRWFSAMPPASLKSSQVHSEPMHLKG